MASPDDINSTLKGIVTNIANEVTAVQALSTAFVASGTATIPALNTIGTAIATTGANTVLALNAIATAINVVFPRVYGTFTLANATVTVVTQTNIKTGNFPIWTATNLTAALTLINHGLYLSVVTAGTGFSVSTGTGVALGSETFSYALAV